MNWIFEKFFSSNYTGAPFQFLGIAHLGAIIFLFILNLYLLRFRNTSDSAKAKIRWVLALILWGNEIAWHYWNYAVGK